MKYVFDTIEKYNIIFGTETFVYKLQRSDVSCSSWPGLHTLQQGFWPTPPYRSSSDLSGFGAVAGQHGVSASSIDYLLGSGHWTGYARTLKCFLQCHSLVALALCLGSLSCWKTKPWPIFNAPTEGRRLLAKILRYMAPSILPSIRCSHPVPFAEMHPQSMMFPPPCFTLGMVFLGLYSSLFFLQTRQVEFIPKSYILVSSDHIIFSHASSGTSDGPGHVLAWAGGPCALQDFNPWRCSVLLMVTVETVVLALFRSLTRSSCVVLGWSLTFLRIIDTPRGEILHGAPVWRRLSVILNFFHFLIIAPTSHQAVCLLSCSPSQPCAGLQFCP